MPHTHLEPPHPPAPDEIIFADLVRLLVRRWRLLASACAGAAAAALVVALVFPKSYTARTSFTPEQSSSGGALANALGSLGGLGSIFGSMTGLTPGIGGATATPDFFAGVLKSQELLIGTLNSRFDVPGAPGQQRTLLEIMRPRGGTPARRLGNAIRKLDDKTDATVDRRSGIVTLAVTLPDPRLAAAVANRMTELLNEFNLERRQFSSREQRRFIAGRLAAAEEQLRAAERAQSAFLLQNRFYSGSPVLEVEATRLSRDVRVQQEVMLGLRKSYEDARIAEVRDTPVLSIIDHAIPPDRPTNPRPVLWTVLAGALGLFAATMFVLVTASRQLAVAAPVATRQRGTGSPAEPAGGRETGRVAEMWARAPGP